MTRPSVLFYCQHLLGIGHISRSLALCRALQDRFDVVFLQGGPDIGRTIDSPSFEHVFLPPLLMREHDSSLYDPAEEQSVEALFAARRARLAPLLTRSFDALVVELFPFGRNKFKTEILEIIEEVRQVNPRAKVYCSNRDIMVKKPDQAHRENKIVNLLHEHFDTVLVHADPNLIPMEETFEATPRIADQIRYTGYVVDGHAGDQSDSRREQRIIVSLGGGAVGAELARACLDVADLFPGYEMHILTGPYTNPDAKAEFEKRSLRLPNVTILGFSDNFRADLSRAALSISLAGYNTLMDVLSTRTPALVYPYMANWEQNMRATALENLGLVGVLYQDTLQREPLSAAIKARLSAPLPKTTIDLSGATSSAELIAHDVVS